LAYQRAIRFFENINILKKGGRKILYILKGLTEFKQSGYNNFKQKLWIVQTSVALLQEQIMKENPDEGR